MGRPKKEKPNRKDGRYEIKAIVGKTFDGKIIRKSFYSYKSKTDAQRQAEQYKIDMEVAARTGNIFLAKDVTFAEWSMKWLETYKKPHVKPHTYNCSYFINVKKYMIPFFGNAHLQDIRQADIQLYFNKHKFLAESNLKRHKNMLHSIFEHALYNDLCFKNPVIRIKYVSEKSPWIKKSYTLEQTERILKYAKHHHNGQCVFILLNTGLRRGELLGLMWKDIDFNKKALHVKRAIEPDTLEIPKDGELKTKSSHRTIPISNDFIEYLKSMERDTAFVLSGNTKWGYTSIDGFNKKYRNFCKEMTRQLDLPYLSPHELRHTYGTILREKGIDLYTISRVLGHSDSSITERVYVHNDIDVLRKRMGLEDNNDE